MALKLQTYEVHNFITRAKEAPLGLLKFITYEVQEF